MKYINNIKKITKEIKGIGKENTKEAAIYLRDKIKQKISHNARSSPGSPPGKRLGDLQKGIKYLIQDYDIAFVGAGPPAQHAHLMEFGTKYRHKKNNANTGKLLARPFIVPTFIEEENNIIKIMSGWNL